MDKIIDTPVDEEMETSFLEYSMSVIISRALPDVRDGLKPVHRRILYAMHDLKMPYDGSTKKCARVVGEVLGRYHPHGDSAIYDSLVRMAQHWSLRLPLVYPHGNFGSPDDGPAASRYTECKLSAAAGPMVNELGENTVDFKLNYDGAEQEPTVLPSAIPNLLVNGTIGIAVGMATSMPSHNLGEVISGLKAMLANPNITLDELMEHIPGPDFPTHCDVVGTDGIKDAYRTGRGVIKMRAVTKIEDVTARKKGIVITALPFMVGPEKVITKVKEMVNLKKLLGVADIKDLSNMDRGMRIVIEVKTGFNPTGVLAELFKLTPLESSFGINNVCLVKQQPQTLGLLDLCRHYLTHRVDVVTRRTQFRLKKAEDRAHIIEGLVIALASIEEVIAIIRKARDTAAARTKLMKEFTLSELQANAILEMRLARLTSLEVSKLKDDLKNLKVEIAGYKRLLGSETLLRDQVGTELELVSESYANPRRSKILTVAPDLSVASASLEIPDEPTAVVLSATGLLGRFDAPFKGRLTKDDIIISSVDTTARAVVGAITSWGRLLRLGAIEIPKAEGRSRGGGVKEFFDLSGDETVVSLVSVQANQVLNLVTASGLVKRVTSDQYPALSGKPVIGLKEGDRVVAAVQVPAMEADRLDLVLVASNAQLLRTPASLIPPKGAPAGGIAGMKLSDGASVIAVGTVGSSATPLTDKETMVTTVSDAGNAKTSLAADYPAKGRGGAGVRAMTFKKAEAGLATAGVGQRLVGVAASGAPVTLPAEVSRRDASGALLETPVVGILRGRK